MPLTNAPDDSEYQDPREQITDGAFLRSLADDREDRYEAQRLEEIATYLDTLTSAVETLTVSVRGKEIPLAELTAFSADELSAREEPEFSTHALNFYLQRHNRDLVAEVRDEIRQMSCKSDPRSVLKIYDDETLAHQMDQSIYARDVTVDVDLLKLAVAQVRATP